VSSKLISKASRIFDHILNAVVVIAGIILIYMMLSVCVDVVMRYFFNMPTIWVVEIAAYCLLFITFLVAAWVLKREGHVKIELLLDRMRPGGQNLLNGITSIIAAIIFLLITWYGAKITWNLYQTNFIVNTVLMPPKFVIMFIIPLGTFLFSIQLVRRACNFLANWRGLPPREESQEKTVSWE